MKTLKKAVQKNVTINKNYYTNLNINDMLRDKKVFYLNAEIKECYEELKGYEIEETVIRVFLENTKEIKVIYHKEFESYETVVVMKDDSILFIEL